MSIVHAPEVLMAQCVVGISHSSFESVQPQTAPVMLSLLAVKPQSQAGLELLIRFKGNSPC